MNIEEQVQAFFKGKSEFSRELFYHFLSEFKKIGSITLHPTKSMIGFVHGNIKVAWLTQTGKNFIHIVFPFKQEYHDNLCFTKIAQVPGTKLYNHHFRMLLRDDVNTELKKFMKLSMMSDS